jgi:hypothetical protein
MADMGDYWRDVKPMLKERNQENRTKNYDRRIEFAMKRFETENIPYKLCNETNAHFNLLHNSKVFMSFWAWTGRVYLLLEAKRVHKKYDGDFARGIENCIKAYKSCFRNNE